MDAEEGILLVFGELDVARRDFVGYPATWSFTPFSLMRRAFRPMMTPSSIS